MRQILLLTAAVLLIACGGDSSGEAVRIEIVPSSTLLVAGESSELKLVGYDKNDKRVSVKGAWSSDAPAIVSVDKGSVSAEAELGSATISVSVGELSATAFAYLADPVPGAVLFSDDQVVSEPIGTVDNGEFVGSFFQIGLRGVTVEPGDIIISRGDTQALGLVSAVDGELITVEIVSLDRVFRNLDYSQTIEKQFTQAELDALATAALPDGTSAHAGLNCSTSGSATITPAFPSASVKPLVAWDGAFKIRDATIEHAHVAAKVGAIFEADGSFELPAEFAGGFDCEEIFWSLPIEGVGMPLAFFGQPRIPFGYGVSAQATIRADAFRVTVSGNGAPKAALGASVTAGVDWTPNNGLQAVFQKSEVNDVKVEMKLASTNSVLDNLRYAFEARIFATSGLDFRPRLRFVDDSDYQLLDFDVGLQQEGDFGNLESQASNDSYNSNYALSGFVRAEMGDDFKKVLKYLGISEPPPIFDIKSSPLFFSPTGTLGVPSGLAELEAEVPLTVSLQETSYFGIYNVQAVRVWRQIGTGPWEMIASELNPTSGQANFTFNWTPTSAEYTDGDIVKLLPTVETLFLPLVNLEIAPDALRQVTIGTPIATDRIMVLTTNDVLQFIDVSGVDAPVILSAPDGSTPSVLEPSLSSDLVSVAYWDGVLDTIDIVPTVGTGGNTIIPGQVLVNSVLVDQVLAAPDWSNDGTRIAFHSPVDEGHIWTMDTNGDNRLRLTGYNAFGNNGSATLPSFSPDGTKVAFFGNFDVDNNRNLYVVDADGTNQTRLNGAGHAINLGNFMFWRPQWSLDSSRVFYVGFGKIYSVAVDGTGLQMLSAVDEFVEQRDRTFFLSPDGTKLAYRIDGEATSIWVMDTDGMNPTQIVADDGSSSQTPCFSWSPDGTQFVYLAEDSINEVIDVHIVDADGTNDSVIYSEANLQCVYWAP